MYLTVKAIHIIAIISWMAGILYLLRLFIYRFENDKHEETKTLLQIMQTRLHKYIAAPAMVVSWICGLYLLATNPGFMKTPWFAVKLICVIAMSVLTEYSRIMIRQFANDTLPKFWTSTRLRIFNEVPTILMIIIVFSVIFKY